MTWSCHQNSKQNSIFVQRLLLICTTGIQDFLPDMPDNSYLQYIFISYILFNAQLVKLETRKRKLGKAVYHPIDTSKINEHTCSRNRRAWIRSIISYWDPRPFWKKILKNGFLSVPTAVLKVWKRRLTAQRNRVEVTNWWIPFSMPSH